MGPTRTPGVWGRGGGGRTRGGGGYAQASYLCDLISVQQESVLLKHKHKKGASTNLELEVSQHVNIAPDG